MKKNLPKIIGSRFKACIIRASNFKLSMFPHPTARQAGYDNVKATL